LGSKHEEADDEVSPENHDGQLNHLEEDEDGQEQYEEERHPLCLGYPKIWLKKPLMKFVSTTAATPSTAAPVQLTTPAPV
jgi:hypothetical protein